MISTHQMSPIISDNLWKADILHSLMATEEVTDIAQVSFPRDILIHLKKHENINAQNATHTAGDFNKRRPCLNGPLPLSSHGCRFELPMDLKILENLKVIHYLTNYCIVSTRRKYLFHKTFMKADHDLDGIINGYELRQALLDLYSNSVDHEHLDDILDIIDCQLENVFDRKQFAAISAFSERYLCARYLDKQERTASKELLEQTDFAGLKSKLEGCNIAPKLVRMLLLL